MINRIVSVSVHQLWRGALASWKPAGSWTWAALPKFTARPQCSNGAGGGPQMPSAFFRAWGSPAVLWVLSEFFSTKADGDFPHTYRTHYRTILGGDFFNEFNSHGGTRTTVTWSSDTRGYPRSPKVHGKSITEEISSGGKDSKRSKDSFKIAYTQRFVHQCISWQLFSCFTFRKNHQTSYFTWKHSF